MNSEQSAPSDPSGEEPGRPSLPSVARDALDNGLATRDVTILPMSHSEAGSAVFHEATVDLVKELRANGVDVGFTHPSDERAYYAERSVEIAVAFVLSIASSAAWDGLLFALQGYRARRKLTVTLVDDTHADSRHRTAHFDGSGAEVLEAMRLYLAPGSTADGDDLA